MGDPNMLGYLTDSVAANNPNTDATHKFVFLDSKACAADSSDEECAGEVKTILYARISTRKNADDAYLSSAATKVCTVFFG